MKKIIILLTTILIVTGCSKAPTSSPDSSAIPSKTAKLSLLAPKGATALATIPLLIDDSADVMFVDGTDVIQAAFVNPTPEYDMIIAPTNLGMKLASMDKTKYRLLGIITWGNLYIVGENENALFEDGTLAAFGEGAVPGLVFEATLNDIIPEVVYYNSVTDAQAALLSGKATSALLAEPAATATIGKLKEQGKDYKIISDLQENFERISGSVGYPQAGVFVLEEEYIANKETIDTMMTLIDNYVSGISSKTMDTLQADIETITPDELGVPNSDIVIKTWDRMNIHYMPASDAKEQLNSFLSLFGIEDVDHLIIK